jgi:hypothetical protein
LVRTDHVTTRTRTHFSVVAIRLLVRQQGCDRRRHCLLQRYKSKEEEGGFMPTYVESAPMARPGLTMTRVSWGAILAGVVIAFAVEIMVALLGAGIGLSLVDPGAADAPGAGSVGIGALAWWAIGTIIALVAGSYAAVRAAGLSRPVEGTVHGLSIWAATLLITLYLMTSAVGGILGGAFRTIGSLAGAAGSGVSAVAPTVSQSAGLDPEAIKTRVEALLAASGVIWPGSAGACASKATPAK